MTLQKWVVQATALGLLFLCGTILAWGGWSEAAVRLCIRVTAASSFFLFMLAFSLSSLTQLWGTYRWLPPLSARRRIGIAFAVSHSFHLAAIAALVDVAYGGDIAQLGNISGGAAIYVLIYLMAASSNNASVNYLGAKNWRVLHKIGGYAIFIGFFSSYLSGVARTGELHYILYSVLAFLVLCLRIYVSRSKRKPLSA